MGDVGVPGVEGITDAENAVERGAGGQYGDVAGGVLGGDRLERRTRQTDGPAADGPGQDRLDELHELRGADDGVRHRAGLEDILLNHLGAVVVQFGQLVHADDRENDEVSDTAFPPRGEEGVHRGPEEGRRGFVGGRGIRRGDDDIGARDGFCVEVLHDA